MNSLRLFSLVFVVCFFAGCVSKPPAFEDSLTARPSIDQSRLAVAKQSTVPAGSGIDRIKYQLASGSESERIQACRVLARAAAVNENDTESIDMLANAIKTDASMKVRMAATDAMGLLQTPEMNKQVASMLPARDLPSEPPTRLSFLKQWWR